MPGYYYHYQKTEWQIVDALLREQTDILNPNDVIDESFCIGALIKAKSVNKKTRFTLTGDYLVCKAKDTKTYVYRILERIGKGGFGVTYLVSDRKGKRWVIKEQENRTVAAHENKVAFDLSLSPHDPFIAQSLENDTVKNPYITLKHAGEALNEKNTAKAIA